MVVGEVTTTNVHFLYMTLHDNCGRHKLALEVVVIDLKMV